ncbi:MAG: tetratricopeptide repeat protein [Planctomycetia bacterium]|nr:tetratricopeptide repeat protein [Planctomycetia bacterium]
MSENKDVFGTIIGILFIVGLIAYPIVTSLDEADTKRLQNDPEYCFEAAMDCFSTKKPKEIEEGFKWLVRAANQGHADAQFVLGFHFVNGIGVPRDLEEGRYWLQLAASQGHLKARGILQQMSLQYPMYYP